MIANWSLQRQNDLMRKLIQTQKQFIYAKEAAEAANLAKGNFLSQMSHEMRTPMNAIIGMANIARSSDAVDRKNYCLNKIDEASAHLLGVINDILDISKIDANKLELAHIKYNFEKVVMKTVNLISFRIEERKQSFTMNLDPKICPSLIGDDQRLAQVITNLLSNAVKFTPENGEIHLNAKLLSDEDNVQTLQIEVSDNGIGISKEQQERLFTPFMQADSSSSRKYGGTGLGLAISKNIVEMMGGKIWIESEFGKGSQFLFTMKAEKDADIEESTGGNVPANGDNGDNEIALFEGDFKGYRILLAEDVEINREIVLSLLEPTALEIDCAVNGAEAVRLFSNNPDRYDLIFMDIQMPEMDGYEAARAIRSLETRRAETMQSGMQTQNHAASMKQIPIIAMTANVFTDDIEKCLASGMNDHIGKPIDFQDVLRMLHRYLRV
jgi:CheY-like chemotaxis protein